MGEYVAVSTYIALTAFGAIFVVGLLGGPIMAVVDRKVPDDHH